MTSGSFVYDAKIEGLDDWNPTVEELRTLSADLVRLSYASYPIERLRVEPKIANDIFANNQFKRRQIPAISANTGTVLHS